MTTIINKDNLNFEALRCLSCHEPPCVEACPASVPIPQFIRALLSGNYDYSADIIRDANPLISICGEVCPAEDYCMSVCSRSKHDAPVKIRVLHKFAAEIGKFSGFQSPKKELSKNHVAVIGSGPAGLSCAVQLRLKGIDVTIYDKSSNFGGVPVNHIPDARLSSNFTETDLEFIKGLDINWRTQEISNLKDLLEEYDAVLLAAGLPNSRKLNIRYEEIPGVFPVLDFLKTAKRAPENINIGERVVVVGGGNVSLDAASAAYRLGAREVHLLYRRSVKEMKVWESELSEAIELGVMVHYLCYPKEFIAESGILSGVICGRNRLSDETDNSGRKKPVAVEGYDFVLPCDTAVVAIGLNPDKSFDSFIENVHNYKSETKGLFIGGDLITGEGTIVEAVRQGKEAAGYIIEYLKGGKW
ncbi:MAG: FAD-dependent oxidoreductase [candidate division Zixibacteria bacterium]|nr:FAD-dependent oxidoreductase [candidate division Zixibacteria bacterium]